MGNNNPKVKACRAVSCSKIGYVAVRNAFNGKMALWCPDHAAKAKAVNGLIKIAVTEGLAARA
jgi:hypothetical protein